MSPLTSGILSSTSVERFDFVIRVCSRIGLLAFLFEVVPILTVTVVIYYFATIASFWWY